MEHEMKLQPEYYNFILNGTKRIEIRLFDEKRQQIKIGDTIKFLKEPELNESFEASNPSTTTPFTVIDESVASLES